MKTRYSPTFFPRRATGAANRQTTLISSWLLRCIFRLAQKRLWKIVAGGRGTRSSWTWVRYSWQLINIHNVCSARVIHINQPWPIRK